jgi:uncharacterized membrane protein
MRSSMVFILSALVLVLPASAGPGIVGLGHLTALDGTAATGISADGNYVTGVSTQGLTSFIPLRWSIAGSVSLQQLPLPSGWTSAQSRFISADGETVLGWRQQGGAFPGFRWSPSTGSVALSNPAGWSQIRTRDVSPDGSAAIGEATISGVGTRAVRWVGANPGTPLTVPVGYVHTQATTFDAFGRIYGAGLDSGGATHLLRWTGDVPQAITPLPSTPLNPSAPFWASADGHVIGGLTSFTDAVPFREESWVWTADNGFTIIPALPGFHSVIISDISADGGLILGTNLNADATTQAAFVWTRDRGTLSLHEFLSEAGVNLTGWTLGTVSGISADGTRLVGSGSGPAGRPEGFLAIIPAPASALALGCGLLLAGFRRRD